MTIPTLPACCCWMLRISAGARKCWKFAASSGGEKIACFHLKETENGYEVIEVEEAQDGSDYAESIKAFTKGYPAVYLKLMNGNAGREDAIREYLRMYVESNQLDIQYYKEYGWDPVEIF